MAKHFLRVRFDERKKLGLAAPSIPDGECRRWVNSGEQKWITSGERQGAAQWQTIERHGADLIAELTLLINGIRAALGETSDHDH